MSLDSLSARNYANAVLRAEEDAMMAEEIAAAEPGSIFPEMDDEYYDRLIQQREADEDRAVAEYKMNRDLRSMGYIA